MKKGSICLFIEFIKVLLGGSKGLLVGLIAYYRPVVPGDAGDAIAPRRHRTPKFWPIIKLFVKRGGGGRICPHITTDTPGFSDLLTALY